jgi:hypothetical protein
MSSNGPTEEERKGGAQAAVVDSEIGVQRVGPLDLVVLSILANLALFTSEWLFFVTKPSMFSELGLAQDLAILLVSALLTLPWILLACTVLSLVWLFIVNTSLAHGARLLIFALPAVILSALELLLIENVTQTLFGFNLSSITGPTRFLYAAGLFGLVGWTGYKLDQLASQDSWPRRRRALTRAALAYAAIAMVVAAVQYGRADRSDALVRPSGSSDELPNVVILSAEALLATHMSAWDDYRQTNPFLETFTKRSLFFENNFANAANSTGSIASLMTGKLPTTTRVVYAPDRLKGRDSLEHLPGILRELGYRNADISIIHYADAFELNIRNGFDMANGRDEADYLPPSFLPKSLELAFESEIFFFGKIRQRLLERLLHAFGIQDIIDPYQQVIQARASSIDQTFGHFQDDERRVEMMKAFIDSGSGPFFVHLHCQGTHGQQYKPRHRRWSKGKVQDDNLMTDFYDDAIIDFDFLVEDVVDFLKRKGLYENSLIVITSDHGMPGAGRTRSRMPLAIRFPNDAHQGRVSVNTQRLDLAPTILDALGVEAPVWMKGTSLLKANEIDPLRPILSSHVAEREALVMDWVVATDSKPPFYSLGAVALVQCNHSYKLNLKNGIIRQSEVPGHTTPCPEDQLFTRQEARRKIVAHLRENGYDVSSLERD